MIELILLIIGIFGLILGTDLIIKGAQNIAEHFKISPLFIGLTVLAIGTDLPELLVAITGGIQKLGGIETSGIILGDAIGSCFGQIGLTLGILGLFGVLTLTKRELLRDGLMMVGSVALLYLVGFDGVITRIEGLLFIIVYVLYFLSLFREEKVQEKVKKAPTLHLSWDIVSLIGGFAILIFSSNIVVDKAIVLATTWGLTQSFIGIVIIGIGTSLPEIMLTIGAISKGAFRLSIGNLIGSNIFDVLFTVGIGSTIAGLNVSSELIRFDIPALFLLSALAAIFFRKDMKVTKKEAATLLGVYAIYILIKIKGAI